MSPEGAQEYADALEAVRAIISREPEADEVLRHVVVALDQRIERYAFVGIAFVEEGDLVLGPTSGAEQAGAALLETPIDYRGDTVGVLRVASLGAAPDEAESLFLEQVADLISPHCLVGWDTGGEPWAEVSP